MSPPSLVWPHMMLSGMCLYYKHTRARPTNTYTFTHTHAHTDVIASRDEGVGRYTELDNPF